MENFHSTLFYKKASTKNSNRLTSLCLQDDVVGKCKVRYGIKSRHLSGRPKVMYKTRNLTECSDRAQTDIGIHVHSYEEKVRRK